VVTFPTTGGVTAVVRQVGWFLCLTDYRFSLPVVNCRQASRCPHTPFGIPVWPLQPLSEVAVQTGWSGSRWGTPLARSSPITVWSNLGRSVCSAGAPVYQLPSSVVLLPVLVVVVATPLPALTPPEVVAGLSTEAGLRIVCVAAALGLVHFCLHQFYLLGVFVLWIPLTQYHRYPLL
jgi:hypothetical protein